MTFQQQLINAWEQHQSLVCVGLDPDINKLPKHLLMLDDPIFEFNRQIIDATAPFCSVYKPQIAYYAAIAAEASLEKTIRYIKGNYPDHPVILDAKRGDIGDTAEMYASEAFDRYGADAVTVNPYMGGDTLAPFLSYTDKGVVVLCRTSNAGSSEFQALKSDRKSLALHVAEQSVAWDNGGLMLVVGATYPEELGEIRRIVGDMPLLVPGVGAQGGDVESVLKFGLTTAGHGIAINSSRGIIYAGQDQDFAQRAGVAARDLNDLVNRYR